MNDMKGKELRAIDTDSAGNLPSAQKNPTFKYRIIGSKRSI